MLTEREQQILDLLRRDPLMGSEALAAALGTTRASINVHVSNLGKKGVILGRGYVLAESPGAVVIGGANMDLKARSRARATHRTSTRGTARWRRAGSLATSPRTSAGSATGSTWSASWGATRWVRTS